MREGEQEKEKERERDENLQSEKKCEGEKGTGELQAGESEGEEGAER